MKSTSNIYLSKKALETNLKFLRKLYGKNKIISSVVKGNAYGHGIEQFVPLAQECGINHFSVFSSNEAFRVKKYSELGTTIVIMGMIYEDELEWAIENKIEFFVFEVERLLNAVKFAKKLNKKAIIHIEIETGMNRTGFNKDDWNTVCEIILNNSKYIELKALCTHFAGAESIANYARILKQKKVFQKAVKYFENKNIKPEILHSACSAASIRYPETRMDMIRVGILQYGFWPSKETYIEYIKNKKVKEDPLKRVISWCSEIMSIKDIEEGEFIGYGTTFLAQKDMAIGVVPVGYSHGFTRSLSNTGRVLVNEKRVSVIGIVNMNLMIIDLTDVEEVKIGDTVTMIGIQGDMEVTVASFSELSNQLNYELLTRLPQDIPRSILVE